MGLRRSLDAWVDSILLPIYMCYVMLGHVSLGNVRLFKADQLLLTAIAISKLYFLNNSSGHPLQQVLLWSPLTPLKVSPKAS